MPSGNFQNLIVGKGETIVNGKTQWEDFVQVYMSDHRAAFAVALDILRQIEAQQNESDKRPVTFSLTGSLETEESSS